MKDFNSYVKENAGKEQSTGQPDIRELIASLAEKYEGASEEQIISAIISEAERGRRNGTLSDRDIDEFAASVAPALDRKQQARLKKIVEYLKRI